MPRLIRSLTAIQVLFDAALAGLELCLCQRVLGLKLYPTTASLEMYFIFPCVCVRIVYTTGVLLPDDGEQALDTMKIELRHWVLPTKPGFSGGLSYLLSHLSSSWFIF